MVYYKQQFNKLLINYRSRLLVKSSVNNLINPADSTLNFKNVNSSTHKLVDIFILYTTTCVSTILFEDDFASWRISISTTSLVEFYLLMIH